MIHQVLEQPALKGMREDLTLVLDPQQIRRQADINEVQLRGLDQSLGDVGMKRGERKDEVAGFQHTQPFACRGVGHPGIAAQAVHVQQLPDPACTQLHERAKGGEVSNIVDLPHIPLQRRSRSSHRGPGWGSDPGRKSWGRNRCTSCRRCRWPAEVGRPRRSRRAAGGEFPFVPPAIGRWPPTPETPGFP